MCPCFLSYFYVYSSNSPYTFYSLLHAAILPKNFVLLYSCYSSDFCLLPLYKTILHQQLTLHTKRFTLGLRSTGFGETGGHKNVGTRM